MKRFIVLLAVVTALAVFTAPTAQAQFAYAKKQTTVSADTLTNADTCTKIFPFTDGYAGITITPVATKISGTVSSKFRVLRSNNGTDYFAIDSLSLTDVSARQWKDVSFTAPVPVYIKVETITSGTQKFATEYWILARKYSLSQ